ncbi:MAG TPA: tetratricopeptide repeat protein [Gemmatimonadaceae bacterium]|jgi:tetratricopeptide (TPR) repeat protein|nr:tetratricopeptide repeat protein [Gemmatimonadaceae bacterium]
MTRLPSRRLCRPLLAARVVFSALAAGAAVVGCSRSAPDTRGTISAPAPRLTEGEVLDLDIEFYKQRADRDPTGATDLARLAGLYLRRSRETGDPSDALRAEFAARRSVRNRDSRNDAAAQVLSASLLAQHRFDEALSIARSLRDRNPDVPSLRAAVGEIQMELGQYDSARVIFDGLAGFAHDLSIAPRLARWAEIEGRTGEARWLMRTALKTAQATPHLPREQVAWFWLRNGDLDLRSGKFSEADSEYRAGLAVHPGDYRLLAAQAKLAATRHEWQAAIAAGEEAIATSLDPATLGVLSDAYAAVGDSAESREYARALDVAVLKQPGAYHRAWSLFLLDHRRHVGTVYRKVLVELQTRRDIYGYDLLAWALHAQGRDAEAKEAMTRALAQGTRDAQLFHHAAAIEHSLGNEAAANALFAQARALEPGFAASRSEGQ